jgi:MoaA/NifB/PqqE/SkfB family radical SAM enzyme
MLTEKAPYVKEVELSNWGEMFLNPNLLGIIRHAWKRGIHLYCENGTNLNTVSNEVLDGVVKFRFKSIICSIDGASQATYAEYRIGGKFSNVIANIEKINTYKKQYQSRFPILTWQFVVFPHNEHEIEQARLMALQLGMGFYMKESWGAIKTSPTVVKHSDMKTITDSQTNDAKVRDTLRSNPGRYICAQLWTGPQVNYDGEMLGCCMVKSSWGAGNVFKSGLLSCINGEKIKLAREMVLGRRKEREDIVCTHCNRFKRMKAHNDWLTVREVMLLRLLIRARRYITCSSRHYAALHNAVVRFMG